MVSKKYLLLSNVVILVVVFALVWLTNGSAQRGEPQAFPEAAVGQAFTYQGRLDNAGAAVTDLCDMTFLLFDDPITGSQVGGQQTISNVEIVDGLFTVALNSAGEFGANAFNGQKRWLSIGVRCPAGFGSYTTLSPRQELSAAPYAAYSLSTGGLQGMPVSAAQPGAQDILQFDGSQWQPATINLRKYYLTTTTRAGNQAISACAAGYHMASLWEIFDVGSLQYNNTLGYNATDSGSGPPASIAGWARTGVPSFTNTVPGNANCNSWTSADPAHNGTRVNLQPQWASAAEFTSPWDSTIQACSSTSRVWCIED